MNSLLSIMTKFFIKIRIHNVAKYMIKLGIMDKSILCEDGLKFLFNVITLVFITSVTKG